MAKCPACNHDVRTPFFFNLDGWAYLTCAQCKARLEMKPRLVAIWFLPIMLSLSAVSRWGHIYAVISEVLLICATIAIVLALVVRPPLRLRKRALPNPEIRLKIDGPSS